MKYPVCLSFALFCLLSLSAAAQESNPAFAEFEEAPGLPRVLLIGDSISIGYTLPVRELLEGKANVHRIPENGGPTMKGLQKLADWLGESRWDLIHFNWGLHDLKCMENGKQQVPLAEYTANLVQLVERLQATGARLLWASTTPVPEGPVSPPRKSQDVVAYNAAAAEIMRARGIAINDLYTLVLARLDELQRPVNVHFTEEGSRVLAEEVARCIERSLSTPGVCLEGSR